MVAFFSTMRWTPCILFLPILVGVSCGRSPADLDAENGVRAVMTDQEDAWNRGDIRGFMEGYDEEVCFLSRGMTTCGREEVTAKYLEHYPDRSTMGTLRFDGVEVVPAGGEHAWCSGQWMLLRSADTLSGGFSLLWMRTPAGWRILRDHTY